MIVSISDTNAAVVALSYKFSLVIRDWLGAEIYDAIELNRAEQCDSVCHTHDFCDANEAMAEAWLEVFGTAADTSSEYVCKIWSAAWCLAKEREFK